jgi:hypothetical protein
MSRIFDKVHSCGNPANLRSEDGKATLWAMLICIVLISTYLKVGRAIVESNFSPLHNHLIIACLGTMAIFTLGCSIHMIFCGDRSSREIKKDIRRQVDELKTFSESAKLRIENLSNSSQIYSATVRPRDKASLITARRILSAIDRRVAEVESMIQSRSSIKTIDAFELLNHELSVIEDCVESLIASEPIPPLQPEAWIPSVVTLLESVDSGMQRIAA